MESAPRFGNEEEKRDLVVRLVGVLDKIQSTLEEIETMVDFPEIASSGQKENDPSTVKFFASAEQDDAAVSTSIRSSSEISEGFKFVEGKAIGRNVFIDINCTSESDIGHGVFLGKNTKILAGGMIGSYERQKWGDSPVIIGDMVFIDKGAKISPNTYIGDYCIIGRNSTIGYFGKKSKSVDKVTIVESGSSLGDNVTIHAGAHVGSGYFIKNDTTIPETIKLEDNSSGTIIEIDNNWVSKYLWEQKREEQRAKDLVS